MINTNKHVKINQSKNTLFDDSNWSCLGQIIYQYRIHSFHRSGIHWPKPIGLGSNVLVRTSVNQQNDCIRPSTFILKDHTDSHRHLMFQKVIHFESKVFQSTFNFYPEKGPSFDRLNRSILYIRAVYIRHDLCQMTVHFGSFGNIHFWLEKTMRFLS